MPKYEYRCTECGHRYETQEGYDAPARQPCPRCGNVAKRILFAPPIVFKGNGFYATDSRKGSSATIGADGGSEGGGDAAKGDDSKPASTAATSDAATSSDTTSSSD